jgi:hypothetical protein
MTEKPDDNTKFRRKDVCEEKHTSLNERCATRKDLCDQRFLTDEEEIKKNSADIRSINNKISATLIFGIVTLLTLLLAILTKLI